MRRISAARVVLLAGAAVALAACSDSTGSRKPAAIVVTGGPFAGTIKATLAAPPTFTVQDDKGHAIGDVDVTILVESGGGTLTGTPAKSGAGPISVGTWKLGATPGINTLRISADGVPAATVTAEARFPIPIEIRYFGSAVPDDIKATFAAANARIQGFFTAEFPDVSLTNFNISSCGVTGVSNITETIHGIVVYASVQPIDGNGGIVGSAGPCFVRSSNGLGLLGIMQFDLADFESLRSTGRLESTITHELLHTLGFGILWSDKGQIQGRGGSDPQFVGLQARAGCLFHGGAVACAPNVPVENVGPSGTRDAHWRNTTFKTEIMTGFTQPPGVPRPLSQITLGSLADLGYPVDIQAYDAYTVPSSAASALIEMRAAQGVDEPPLKERLVLPGGAVTPSGQVVRIPR